MTTLPKIDWRPQGDKAHTAAQRVVLVYLVVALSWILLSDALVAQIASDPRHMQQLQTLKGWAFVAVTALIFYALVYRRVLFALRTDAVERQVNYDVQTGLPNAALLATGMHQLLLRVRGGSDPLWVFAIQANEYPRICDSLGGPASNQVLQEVAGRLRCSLTGADLLARHQGAVFLAVVQGGYGATDRLEVVTGLRAAFREPVTVAEHVCPVTLSIGVSECPGDGETAEELIDHAIAAMNRAAQQPGIDAFNYTESFRREAYETYRLEADLHRAAEEGAFTLVYQPQIALREARCCAVEALLRWRHPQWGDIPPGRFIPLAERSELILKIGEWVLSRACADAMRWQRMAGGPLRVAVNLSSRQFNDPALGELITTALGNSGLPPQCLEIEITETAAMDDPQVAMAIVRDLRALGVQVAIDDFGTGYSSLSYLRNLGVDRLKIDRCFVSGTPEDAANLEICRAILGLCRGLGITCLAEGIERTEELAALVSEGCEEGQGWLFARPMTEPALREWLKAGAGIHGHSIGVSTACRASGHG